MTTEYDSKGPAARARTAATERRPVGAGETREPGRGTIAADLERPIPLLGRRAQHLGDIRKLFLSLEDRSIRRVELITPWQTLQLHGATVAYDERRGVFRLRRRERSGSDKSGAQSSSSSAR
jgi:hypothetical protein